MTINDVVAAAATKSARFRKALKVCLQLECSFDRNGHIETENVEHDSGGDTFAGIDRSSHPNFNFASPEPLDVVNVYWDEWGNSESLPYPVGECVFLQGVNQGARVAARLLQASLNDLGCEEVDVDGSIGKATLRASWKQGIVSNDLARAFLGKSRNRYKAIIAGNPKLMKFYDGWNNRVDAIQREFLA